MDVERGRGKFGAELINPQTLSYYTTTSVL